MLPQLEEFRRQVYELKQHPAVASRLTEDRVALSSLPLAEVAGLLATDAGYYFLLAAAQLNRTSLRRAVAEPENQVVERRLRKAYAIRTRLPVNSTFDSIAASALAMRQGDLQRQARGQVEQVFRDRLAAEGVPLLMSPPARTVPGVVIPRRKPDGVWPDPATGAPPKVYLEIKNIRRVADDIQKRLYELAEASLEMKLLYGEHRLTGLAIADNTRVGAPSTVEALRVQITGQIPYVVGLFICPRAEAERYRAGAEAIVDRVFFQEEIDECIAYLKAACRD